MTRLHRLLGIYVYFTSNITWLLSLGCYLLWSVGLHVMSSGQRGSGGLCSPAPCLSVPTAGLLIPTALRWLLQLAEVHVKGNTVGTSQARCLGNKLKANRQRHEIISLG